MSIKINKSNSENKNIAPKIIGEEYKDEKNPKKSLKLKKDAKIEADKPKQQEKPSINKNIKVDEVKEADKVKEQRYNELTEELAEAVFRDAKRVDIDFNEFEEDSYNRRYKRIMIKKWVIIITAMVTMLTILGLAAYKVFSDKELTGPEIAYYANHYNGDTNFPEYGVENFISANINSIVSNQVQSEDRDSAYKFENVQVDNIYKKDDDLADVYFFADLVTKKGNSRIYYMMPIKYKDGAYKASEPIITSLKSSSYDASVSESKRLKFDDEALIDDNASKNQKAFADNFFKMFYSGQNVSPFYKGPDIKRDPNQSYEGMTDFKIYSKPNEAGYNACANIIIELPGKIKYTTKKYMVITPNDKTFTIDSMN